jgi:hypothetical protein
MSQYGYERESGSNELIPMPMSSWNVVSQAGGFTRAPRPRRASAAAFDVNQEDHAVAPRRHAQQVLRGMDHGDGAAMGKAIEQMVMVAMNNPEIRQGAARDRGRHEEPRQTYMPSPHDGRRARAQEPDPLADDVPGYAGPTRCNLLSTRTTSQVYGVASPDTTIDGAGQ